MFRSDINSSQLEEIFGPSSQPELSQDHTRMKSMLSGPGQVSQTNNHPQRQQQPLKWDVGEVWTRNFGMASQQMSQQSFSQSSDGYYGHQSMRHYPQESYISNSSIESQSSLSYGNNYSNNNETNAANNNLLDFGNFANKWKNQNSASSKQQPKKRPIEYVDLVLKRRKQEDVSSSGENLNKLQTTVCEAISKSTTDLKTKQETSSCKLREAISSLTQQVQKISQQQNALYDLAETICIQLKETKDIALHNQSSIEKMDADMKLAANFRPFIADHSSRNTNTTITTQTDSTVGEFSEYPENSSSSKSKLPTSSSTSYLSNPDASKCKQASEKENQFNETNVIKQDDSMLDLTFGIGTLRHSNGGDGHSSAILERAKAKARRRKQRKKIN